MTNEQKYAIGVDFGTESGRALLVEVATGRELATSIYPYANGVIDQDLPLDDRIPLPPDTALQDPEDYVRTLQHTVPDVLSQGGVNPSDVIGIGIDFTACTILPTTEDGVPLCVLPEYRRNPHAWVKLWKHHASQPQADKINAVARERGDPWLPRYGGKISSEWFFPKALQILDEAPDVYAAAGFLIEAADWVVWRLTGEQKRNSCTAGYKAMWSKREGYPSEDYFAALDSRAADIIDDKMSREIFSIGECAGGLTEEAVNWTGLRPGTPVAVANVDAHVSVPAATVTEPGRMVMVMGTSTCHLVLSPDERIVEGMCGVVEDGILPGLFGYEAGQSAVGDIFAWFVESCVPPQYHERAIELDVSVHQVLEAEAAKLQPGESGLLALDWWNGNRSVLVNANLSGLILGMTLGTTAPEMYRALIEATAFGTRVIVDAFNSSGVAVNDLVACGGLPNRNRLMMQIYADVLGMEISVATSEQTPALGSAMFGAVAAGKAAGGYESIFDAAQHMAHLRDEKFTPIEANQQVYERLYRDYLALHDCFGRGGNSVMKILKEISASSSTTVPSLKEEVSHA